MSRSGIIGITGAMAELFVSYQSALTALGTLGILLFVQLLVADVVGLTSGHKPGAGVAADHSDFFFRTTRAVANANESIAIFIIALLFCVLSGADPKWTNNFAWVYVGARIAYTFCYYLDLRMYRSICFVVSLVGLVGLLTYGFLS